MLDGAGAAYDDDRMVRELDPGIRETVKFLRQNGFCTTDSGDGYSKVQRAKEEDPGRYASSVDALPYPHVFMSVPPDSMVSEAARLWKVISTRVKRNAFVPGGDANIEVMYSPIDGEAVLSLLGVDDDLIK